MRGFPPRFRNVRSSKTSSSSSGSSSRSSSSSRRGSRIIIIISSSSSSGSSRGIIIALAKWYLYSGCYREVALLYLMFRFKLAVLLFTLSTNVTLIPLLCLCLSKLFMLNSSGVIFVAALTFVSVYLVDFF